MNINFNFKNFEPSPHLKDYAESRFAKLGKYVLDSDEPEVVVNLSVEKFRQMVDVIVSADYVHLSAFEESEDMYSTIDMVLDKLEAQLRKMREKLKDKRRSGRGRSVRMDFFSLGEDHSGPVIRKTDKYEPKPMTVDEAAMQLDNLGYEFLVFLNADNEEVNVIYRRKSGEYGLIDPGY